MVLTSSKAYLFPGQGSQKKGMGEEVFKLFPDLVEEANAILGYSIEDLCIDDAKNRLGYTQYTQPALYVVSALMYLKKLQEARAPDYVAGHSLGEYTALFAGGVYDFTTGLKLVQKRGEIMAKVRGGGMAAIIGLSEGQIREVLKANLLDAIDIANLNAPTQIVISGPNKALEQTLEIFQQAGARHYIPLQVSGAFHSRYMQEPMKEFADFLASFVFGEPKIPIISNVDARPYTQEKIRQLLTKQISKPLKWTESIRYLIGEGVEEFEEIGPGSVLMRLVAKIRQETVIG